jgi:hypothetical protein
VNPFGAVRIPRASPSACCWACPWLNCSDNLGNLDTSGLSACGRRPSSLRSWLEFPSLVSRSIGLEVVRIFPASSFRRRQCVVGGGEFGELRYLNKTDPAEGVTCHFGTQQITGTGLSFFSMMGEVTSVDLLVRLAANGPRS